MLFAAGLATRSAPTPPTGVIEFTVFQHKVVHTTFARLFRTRCFFGTESGFFAFILIVRGVLPTPLGRLLGLGGYGRGRWSWLRATVSLYADRVLDILLLCISRSRAVGRLRPTGQLGIFSR